MREAVNGTARKGKKFDKEVSMKQILKLNFRIFKNYSLAFGLLVIRR